MKEVSCCCKYKSGITHITVERFTKQQERKAGNEGSIKSTCTKEWVGITHIGMNNTFWCLRHFSLGQDVLHTLVIMEIEADCESEKKLSQKEYVKWVERYDHSY